MKEISVLVVGRSHQGIEDLEAHLRDQPGIAVRRFQVNNGHVDPLHNVAPLPDLLVLDLSALWEDELRALAARSTKHRPIIIAVGPEGNTRMIRMAMQAGARDFFTHPVPGEELRASIAQVAIETTARGDAGGHASITAFINAKGGAGASLIACNLAHVLAAHQRRRVVLVDLDLQFGTLPVYLNLQPRESLLDALAAYDHLDAVALDGYLTRHKSGLRLLAAVSERLALPWEIPADRVGRLIEMMAQNNDHVVLDLPRQMDPATTAALARADRIYVVMQQELTHLRDAKRMLHILMNEFAISRKHVHMVVNRYDPNGGVRGQDIHEALEPAGITTIPSDYPQVVEAVNLGVPLYDHARNAPITQAILDLARSMDGGAGPKEKGRLQHAVARLLGR